MHRLRTLSIVRLTTALALAATLGAVAVLARGGGPAAPQDPTPPPRSLQSAFPAQKHYSPYAGRNFPTQVYWGDTHLHTGMSMDAGAFGARLKPPDAYRFARGEELTSSTGLRVKLSWPLDFLVVADHSDNMGFFPRLFEGDPGMLADPTGRRWYDMVQAGGQDGVKAAMLQYEYARSALQLGLLLEQKFGVNPYKFGMIGSTDSHTALATAEEENFFGKHSGTEPSPQRWEHPMAEAPTGRYEGWSTAASGYAAVWARENTREAIFDAMMRRETYATTGSRMFVRFFGGWTFTAADAQTRLPADVGYMKGVPMGGDLPPASASVKPTFLVASLKDPYSGNLDRIQIVKGWVDAAGGRHEKVFDVVWSDADRRRPGADGKLPAVGNTVDVANATWTNTIGAPELITVWTDPEFDPSVRAVYYARVIEIPTPRWTAYDAKRFGVKMSPEVPMVTQERAYTSPIWYTPGR